MEIEILHGARERIHAPGDYYAINRISNSPFLFTNHLIKTTIQLRVKDGLKQGVDFKASSKNWVRLQSTSNNGQQQTYEKYTGKLPFVHSLQNLKL